MTPLTDHRPAGTGTARASRGPQQAHRPKAAMTEYAHDDRAGPPREQPEAEPGPDVTAGACPPAPAPAGGPAAGHRGDLDLADRHALRRVAWLSTELEDVTEVEYRALRLERVVLMGVWTDGTLTTTENSLRELSLLAETAGSQVLEGLIQR